MSTNRIRHLLDQEARDTSDASQLLRKLFAVRAVVDRFDGVRAAVAPDTAVLLAIDCTDEVGQAILQSGKDAGRFSEQHVEEMLRFSDKHGLGKVCITVVDQECAEGLYTAAALNPESAKAKLQRCLSHGTGQMAVAWKDGKVCVAAVAGGAR